MPEIALTDKTVILDPLTQFEYKILSMNDDFIECVNFENPDDKLSIAIPIVGIRYRLAHKREQ